MTIHPELAAFGTNSDATFEPTDENTNSHLLKSNLFKSKTFIFFFPKDISFPSDLEEASKNNSSTGNFLYSIIDRNSLPTFPVAPNIEILIPIF